MTSRRGLSHITPRHVGAVLLDAATVAVAFRLAFLLRMQGPLPPPMAEVASAATPWVVLISIMTFEASGLYRRAWRYVSVDDVLAIGRASVLAVLLSTIAIILMLGRVGLPTSVPIICWLVLIVLMSGMRVTRRLLRETLRRARRGAPRPPVGRLAARPANARVLVIGEPDWIETLLRILQRRHGSAMKVVGALGHDEASHGLSLPIDPYALLRRQGPRATRDQHISSQDYATPSYPARPRTAGATISCPT